LNIGISTFLSVPFWGSDRRPRHWTLTPFEAVGSPQHVPPHEPQCRR
jgi:hypothetical protein